MYAAGPTVNVIWMRRTNVYMVFVALLGPPHWMETKKLKHFFTVLVNHIIQDDSRDGAQAEWTPSKFPLLPPLFSFLP